MIRSLGGQVGHLIVTQNGQIKVVVQDVASHWQMQENIALLKILSLGGRQINESQFQPVEEVIARLRDTGVLTGKRMSFLVQLTDNATCDLEEIFDCTDRHDSPTTDGYVLNRFENTFSSLSDQPYRCSYPKELLEINVCEYREFIRLTA